MAGSCVEGKKGIPVQDVCDAATHVLLSVASMCEALEPCPQCQGTSWTVADGISVCEFCGTQSQVYVQEAQEFQTGIDDLRYRRKAGSKSASANKNLATEWDIPNVSTIRATLMLYTKALQQGLQVMMQPLQNLCGIDQCEIARFRRIWMAILSDSGILTLDFARGLRQSMGEVLPVQRAWRVVLKGAAWKVLPPDLLLVVLFLGCWSARQAVTGMDILHWANDGALPFLSLHRQARSLLEDADASALKFPASLLQPTGVMAIQDLISLSAQRAHQIDLHLPPVNAPALIQRFSQELSIPQGAARVALELFEVHLGGTPQMRLQDDIHMHPYAHIMAVIIVTIKLLYCLDIDGSHARDLLTHAAMDWKAWAEAVVKGSRGSVTFPYTAAEASMMTATEWDIYLQVLRSITSDSAKGLPGLQDVTEAACKRASSPLAQASEGRSAAPHTEIPAIHPPPEGAEGNRALYRLSCTSEPARLYSMGPDYAALVTACAAHLSLQPLYLHRAVIKLETQMRILESKADGGLL